MRRADLVDMVAKSMTFHTEVDQYLVTDRYDLSTDDMQTEKLFLSREYLQLDHDENLK